MIPSFLKRVDLDDRGVAWSDYLAQQPRRPWTTSPRGCFPADDAEPTRRRRSRLVDFDPDGEVKLVAAMLYPHIHLPEDQIERAGAGHVGRRPPGRRAGLRRRPHQPPPQAGPGARAHRLPLRRRWPTTAPSATCSATGCSPSSGRRSRPRHGYTRPEAVDARRRGRPRSTRPWSARPPSTTPWPSAFPAQASYAVCAGLQGALRHADERPRGHAPDRAAHHARRATPPTGVVGQEMHRLIAEEAGHQAVAEMMRFVDHTPSPASSGSTPSGGPRPGARAAEPIGADPTDRTADSRHAAVRCVDHPARGHAAPTRTTTACDTAAAAAPTTGLDTRTTWLTTM